MGPRVRRWSRRLSGLDRSRDDPGADQIHFGKRRQSEKVVRLHDYPDWTVVAPPDSGPIARIEIESLDFVGKGPAIAAVKAFRKEW